MAGFWPDQLNDGCVVLLLEDWPPKRPEEVPVAAFDDPKRPPVAPVFEEPNKPPLALVLVFALVAVFVFVFPNNPPDAGAPLDPPKVLPAGLLPKRPPDGALVVLFVLPNRPEVVPAGLLPNKPPREA